MNHLVNVHACLVHKTTLKIFMHKMILHLCQTLTGKKSYKNLEENQLENYVQSTPARLYIMNQISLRLAQRFE